MKQKRAYRSRCYPTTAQATQLAQTFGCARFVYNWGLRLRTDAYYEQHKKVGYAETSAALTELKKQPQTIWLNDVSSVPTQQALRHLDRGFQNFFEGRAKYPTFKQKRGRQSATYANSAFSWDGATHTLKLAKMSAPLKIVWSRFFSAAPSTITISCDTAGRYFVSFLVEEEIGALPPLDTAVGIDVGLKSLVTLSTGEKVAHPKHLAKNQKRMKHAQQNLSRKQKGSKNRTKARRKVARIHAQIADQRLDSLHKLTTRIIRENQTICVESLAVKNMLRNHSLAKAIADASWGELLRQLEYKAAWYGRTLVKIDRWYPSSKRCFDCGQALTALALDVREWTCPACGTSHDRDVNAAKNIGAVGLTVLACGETVRPTKDSSRVGSAR